MLFGKTGPSNLCSSRNRALSRGLPRLLPPSEPRFELVPYLTRLDSYVSVSSSSQPGVPDRVRRLIDQSPFTWGALPEAAGSWGRTSAATGLVLPSNAPWSLCVPGYTATSLPRHTERRGSDPADIFQGRCCVAPLRAGPSPMGCVIYPRLVDVIILGIRP